ncbi:hypothetical protein BDV19DRAFT_154442 [Aspergillus venezuelensis]
MENSAYLSFLLSSCTRHFIGALCYTTLLRLPTAPPGLTQMTCDGAIFYSVTESQESRTIGQIECPIPGIWSTWPDPGCIGHGRSSGPL